jgi:hypothetical protein
MDSVDSMFIMGHDHNVCEDYAYSGKFVICDDGTVCKSDAENELLGEEVSFAVISDGCSSSDNTEMGARLLCYSFVETILEHYKMCSEFDGYHAEIIGDNILKNTIKEVPNFDIMRSGVKGSCLDATLFGVFADREKVYVFGWGDGVVAVKSKDGVDVNEVVFESNAPYYLSYRGNSKRDEIYKKEFGGAGAYCELNMDNEDGRCGGRYCFDSMSKISFFKAYEGNDDILVSVMSDGVGSYFNTDLEEVVKEMTAYKGFNGNFVKRRMKRFERDCVKDGVKHADDISCASFYRKVSDD